MSNLIRFLGPVSTLVAFAVCSVAVAAPPADKPPKEPARIQISVAPEQVQAGGQAEVTLQLTAKSGIRINRYPKISLTVPEQDGVAAEAEVSIGNDGPPPADDAEANYYDTVDPLRLQLELDPGVKPGDHEFDAKLVYFYCVKKSGFCAPKRLQVKIPVSVR